MTTQNRGFILVLSSPSGCGKTTVAKKLLEDDSNLLSSISVTTRQPREKEIEGKDYFFKNKTEFDQLIFQNHFLEYAEVFGQSYGTPKDFVKKKLLEGKNIVFDIDYQGVIKLKKIVPQDIVTVFMLPPSMRELRNRLVSRNSDHMEEIEKRIREATLEISKAPEYDYIIINDDLEQTIKVIQNILIAEQYKKNSSNTFVQFQKNLCE